MKKMKGKLEMTRTLKTIITFVITVVMFAAMSANTFAITDAELRELAALPQLERIARTKGLHLTVEESLKLSQYVHENRVQTIAKNRAMIAQYGDGCIVTPEYEWALPELSEASKVGLTYKGLAVPMSNISASTYNNGVYVKFDTILRARGYVIESTGESTINGYIYYIWHLVCANIVRGYNDIGIYNNKPGIDYDCYMGTDDKITRQEYAILAARLLEFAGVTTDKAPVVFKDADKFVGGNTYTAEDAKAAASLLVNLGIISPDENGNFDPTGNLYDITTILANYRLYTFIPQWTEEPIL